jgi:two-component system chemotaxis sensor kinase CheA
MADKKFENAGHIKAANISSILMVLLLSVDFIIETYFADYYSGSGYSNYSVVGLVVLVSLIMVFVQVKYTVNYYKMAFNVPIVLFLFYTSLMALGRWSFSQYYLLICLSFCVISCIYSSFGRTLFYIAVQNILIGLLILRGVSIAGRSMPLSNILVYWAVCIIINILMIVITKSATIALKKALENQNAFRDLLYTTENYVAMVDEHNEIVYASRTISQLGNTDEPTLVQGRPLIDIFPGKSLKIYAGKMLREKDLYAEDWEFTLNGQKRYFKAASHSLPGQTGGALISLYDMTHLAERDEIAVMKDSMQIGLFFMDQNFVIQDHYSRYLEEMLSETDLFGRLFTDIISQSVNPSELEAIKDYFGMVIERSYDQEMLDDINPLNELHYVNVNTGDRKVFQCAFATVERGHGEVFILVTVYDITTRVELAKRLQEEEAKRQEEMQSVFELIQVSPDVFSDFTEDMEYEFGNIDKILKDNALSAHDVLVKVYQSVHAIKSNAVILGLSVFGNKVHNLESKIKQLREKQGEIPFVEMLNLTVDIESISKEREGFKVIIEKLQSYGGGNVSGEKQNVRVMVESLAKTASRGAEDMEKMIKFIAEDIDAEAIDKGPRRVMKEVLMQLIRNSVVHGIELPEVRKEKGKNETGVIKLAIKMVNDNIQMKLTDDGKGLDYKRIAEKALAKKMIKKEDVSNTDLLMKVIFMPGFSTAETEGVHAGRGIGLNLVRDRIKEVNGVVKLRSEAGKGTVFFVSIPVAPAEKKD